VERARIGAGIIAMLGGGIAQNWLTERLGFWGGFVVTAMVMLAGVFSLVTSDSFGRALSPTFTRSRAYVGALLSLLVVVWLAYTATQHSATASKTSDQARNDKAPSTQIGTESPAPAVQSVPPSTMMGDRIVVNVTPDYLMGIFRERTTADARRLTANYIGKWMRISGTVYDVDRTDLGRGKEGNFVTVIWNKNTSVSLVFHEQRWMDSVSVWKRGDTVTVLGQIQHLGALTIILNNCELP